jgi:redox-sensitive bicupin YhaK (pirin superfamily)
VTLSPGSRFEQDLERFDSAFLWIFAGTATAVTPHGGVPLASFDHVGYANDGDRICLEGGPDGARAVLFSGTPLDEPIAARGPFVMATAGDLDEAFANYRSGKMGTLTPTAYGPDQRPIT